MSSGFKVFVPCAEDCYVQERGEVEYIVSGPTLYRAKDGTKRGNSTTWYTFRCNSANCPGLAGIRWDVLMKFIAFGINARTRFDR